MKKIILALVIFVFAFRIWQTSGCKNYHFFKFEPISVKINVEEQVNTDIGQNRQVSRIFHNKASATFYEITKSYAKLFDSQFILDILGPIGVALMFLALIYTFKTKKLFTLSHLIIVVATPFLVLIGSNTKISLFVQFIAMYSFSLWGIKSLMPNKLQIFGIIFLAISTLWYFALSWQLPSFCNEIFFN